MHIRRILYVYPAAEVLANIILNLIANLSSCTYLFYVTKHVLAMIAKCVLDLKCKSRHIFEFAFVWGDFHCPAETVQESGSGDPHSNQWQRRRRHCFGGSPALDVRMIDLTHVRVARCSTSGRMPVLYQWGGGWAGTRFTPQMAQSHGRQK